MSSSVARVGHLTRRFASSLWPAAPSATADAWVRGILSPAEYDLWSQLPNHDRRHSIAVARRVTAALTATEHVDDPRWSVAALLHDVGKLDADLGVLGRVGATLAGAAGGRARATRWSSTRGARRRVGLYLRHPELGAAQIRRAGGNEEAARWAEAHHDRTAWGSTGIPATVVTALHDADDD